MPPQFVLVLVTEQPRSAVHAADVEFFVQSEVPEHDAASQVQPLSAAQPACVVLVLQAGLPEIGVPEQNATFQMQPLSA